ncbi:lipopolysaccharide biosynthesis protein [Vibrio panuliri]|uniref:Lipopolysaccharide biosynthesis protein n=1 Tax=Vibrio panuliri TaxID=1381081 RepID=A0ABX3FCS7_9VIBR|nr:hypothetical protein [Vibrio panuliri]OLQ89295.1 hypothetical protein BIY20_11825 [Vibrio panuliri]
MSSSANPVQSMFLYGLALLFLKGASLIALPVMTFFLTVEQIGQLELIAVTQTFFALLVSLSMHENLYRFVATIDSRRQRHLAVSQLYNTTMLLSLTFIALLTIGYWLYHRYFAMDHGYFTPTQLALMAGGLAVQGSIEISLAWLRLQDKAWTFFKLSLFCASLQVGLIIAAVSLSPTVTTVLAVGVFCVFVQLTLLHLHNQFQLKLLNIQQLKAYLKYCLPIMLSALVAFALNGGERWMLVQGHRFDLLAQYAIALKFSLAVGILLQPFHMWWMPKRFEYWRNSGESVTSKISQFGIVYACLLALAVTWGGKIFISVFLPTQYQLASYLIAVTVIAMLFKELTEIINIGLLKAKRTQTLFTINACITLFFVGSILIICRLSDANPLWIVSIGICFAQALRCSAIFIASQSLSALPYQTGRAVLFICLTASLILSTWLVNATLTSAVFLMLELITLAVVAHHINLFKHPFHKMRKAMLRMEA